MKNMLVIDIFKINKKEKEMILLKAPYGEDVVIKMNDKELDRVINKYSYFIVKNNEDEVVFGQDLSDESNMSYHTRKMFKEEFKEYYI